MEIIGTILMICTCCLLSSVCVCWIIEVIAIRKERKLKNKILYSKITEQIEKDFEHFKTLESNEAIKQLEKFLKNFKQRN